MAFDLSTLSAEEKATLQQALGGDGQESPLDQVVTVLSVILEKVEALEERQSKLESVVCDEIIGGIDKLYQGNLRMDGIKGLRGKYSDLFGPMEGHFKELYSSDIYEKLYELLGEMKGQPDFTDEMGDAKIKEIAEQFKGKLGKVRGEKAPEAAAVEVTKVEEPAPEPDAMAGVIDSVRKLKKSGRVSGITGEPRD